MLSGPSQNPIGTYVAGGLEKACKEAFTVCVDGAVYSLDPPVWQLWLACCNHDLHGQKKDEKEYKQLQKLDLSLQLSKLALTDAAQYLHNTNHTITAFLPPARPDPQ